LEIFTIGGWYRKINFHFSTSISVTVTCPEILSVVPQNAFQYKYQQAGEIGATRCSTSGFGGQESADGTCFEY
jgi:hypothetical protein